jgi:uncharacterized protein with HEPN domain
MTVNKLMVWETVTTALPELLLELALAQDDATATSSQPETPQF